MGAPVPGWAVALAKAKMKVVVAMRTVKERATRHHSLLLLLCHHHL